jgi:hypothetical protein
MQSSSNSKRQKTATGQIYHAILAPHSLRPNIFMGRRMNEKDLSSQDAD